MDFNTDILNDIPLKALWYLSSISESEEDTKYFFQNVYTNFSNIYIAIAEFRLEQLNKRNFSFEDFSFLYEKDCEKAISKLFLYPFKSCLIELIIEPIARKEFSLKDLYKYQSENLVLNPILVGKDLKRISKI